MSRRQSRTRAQDQTLVDIVRDSPVDRQLARMRCRLVWILVAVLALAVGAFAWRFLRDRPVDYADAEEHYKYGSIGSEPGGPLTGPVGGLLPPDWVFKVLPDICPEMLPGGYAAAGVLFEEGRDLPIGVSQRYRLGLNQVGVNCAFCHTGSYRATPDDETIIVPGMPSHQLAFQDFTRLLVGCPQDPRFSADNVLGKIEAAGGDLGAFDRFLYKQVVIPQTVELTRTLGRRIAAVLQPPVTDWGRGRVDTFNPYKSIQFNWKLEDLPPDEIQGASDFPSLWNQAPRDGMQLHWDGNNDSVDERNLSASLGAGVTPVTIDHARLKRVRDWIWTLPAPEYPFAIDDAIAARGQELYARHCVDCHADHRFREGVVEGTRVGKVVPIEAIRTDPFRLNSYTYTFAANQYTLYPDSEYRFHHFRKTGGYANHPLDGVWARAPYLHNGSVPTLRDLLEPPESRPKAFYRGYDVFDQTRVGFVHDVAAEGERRYSLYDTSLPGNGNGGHEYALDLAPEDKDALVEYMKRL